MTKTTNIHGTGEGNLTLVLPVSGPYSRHVRGYVYFLSDGVAIKIGFSFEPSARKNELQVGNHKPLMLLAIVPAAMMNEREVHQRFDEFRIRGEWFSPEPELLKFIEELKPKPGKMPVECAQFKGWADNECPKWPIPLMAQAALAASAIAMEYRTDPAEIEQFQMMYEAWRLEQATAGSRAVAC